MSGDMLRTHAQEGELLDAALGGDERAYQQLVEPYRRELHAQCYRMLGSPHDADDAVQDALLRAWRGLAGFAQRSSVRTWLHKITANVCLAMLEKRPRQALPVDYGPPADPDGADWAVADSWVQPYPDRRLGPEPGLAAPAARYEQRESVELAFMAACQHLVPRQRAVLLLRDVLGFSAKEVANLLDTTVASVTSALQRARTTVRERLPEQSQQANLRSLGDARVRRLVESYVEAWERADLDAILAMLADDATFTMPPHLTWFRGRDAIARFIPQGPFTERWRLVPARANGQLAFGCYAWRDEAGAYVGNSIDLLTVRDGKIAQITAFLTPEILPAFGLPTQLQD
jgi:RNA polymerase sigma-70 factor (ECF subfamily)